MPSRRRPTRPILTIGLTQEPEAGRHVVLGEVPTYAVGPEHFLGRDELQAQMHSLVRLRDVLRRAMDMPPLTLSAEIRAAAEAHAAWLLEQGRIAPAAAWLDWSKRL